MAKVTKAALARMAEALVSNGVALLDTYWTNHKALVGSKNTWRDKINVQTLDVSKIADCPLGQVFGGYGSGLHVLFGSYAYDHAQLYGFNAPYASQVRGQYGIPQDVAFFDNQQTDVIWEELRKAWKRAVRKGAPANAA